MPHVSPNRRLFDSTILFAMQANSVADQIVRALNFDVMAIQTRLLQNINEFQILDNIPFNTSVELMGELGILGRNLMSTLERFALDASEAYSMFVSRNAVSSSPFPEQGLNDLQQGGETIFDVPSRGDVEEEDEEEGFLLFPLSFSEILLLLSAQWFSNQTALASWQAFTVRRSSALRDQLNASVGLFRGGGDLDVAGSNVIGDLRRLVIGNVAGTRRIKQLNNSVASIGSRLAQTLTLGVTNQIIRRMALNAGFTKFRWTAILDDRTCLRCVSLDGRQFASVRGRVQSPQIPLHFLCRCLLIPVASSVESHARRRGDFPKDFVQWFNDLSAVRQKQTLGPSRFKLFDSGKFKFRDFIQFNGMVPTRVKPISMLV